MPPDWSDAWIGEREGVSVDSAVVCGTSFGDAEAGVPRNTVDAASAPTNIINLVRFMILSPY
jgi:hypothetical protein